MKGIALVFVVAVLAGVVSSSWIAHYPEPNCASPMLMFFYPNELDVCKFHVVNYFILSLNGTTYSYKECYDSNCQNWSYPEGECTSVGSMSLIDDIPTSVSTRSNYVHYTDNTCADVRLIESYSYPCAGSSPSCMLRGTSNTYYRLICDYPL